MKIAVCPGSFDPITKGHVDIIQRAASLFDRVYVCTLVNTEKPGGMFDGDTRLRLMRKALSHLPNVTVESFCGLAADYAAEKNATVLVKGVRNSRDLEDEIVMSEVNRRLEQGLETVLFPARPEYLLCSSTVAREMLRYGRPADQYVPAEILKDLEELLHI